MVCDLDPRRTSAGWTARRGGRTSSRRARTTSSRSRRCRSTIRCGCCTAPARRAAEGDRARARRDPAGDAEDAPPPRRPARGRSRFWFTTTGWMMWNFLNGGLLTDASVVLFDGNPGHPDLGTLWDLAEEAGVTCFGTSASFVAACMKAGSTRGRVVTSRLEALGSTGSPLSPEAFDWLYERLGPDLWLFSTSGGTDVCTAFVGGVPRPVVRGELQARALGAPVEAWNEAGEPVVGEVGELVLTQPMPSMPVRLWGDDDGTRYRASYFDTFPGVWRHGDWIEITDGDRHHHRTLRRDDQPRRDPDGHGRDLQRSAGARRRRRRARGRPAARGNAGYMPLVVLREAPCSTTTSSHGSAHGSVRTARRGTCPTRYGPYPPCRGRCRARCSRCRSSGSSRASPRTPR